MLILAVAGLPTIALFAYFHDDPVSHELHSAVLDRDHARVQELIDAGADPNTIVRELWFTMDGLVLTKRNALHLAAVRDAEIVRILLEADVDLTIPDHHGQTPLELATALGNVTATLLLFEATRSLPDAEAIIARAQDTGGCVIYDLAGHTEDKVFLTWLAEQRGSPGPPLIQAARTPGFADEVERLLRDGELAEQRDDFGWTGAIWASGAYGDTATLRALLAAGADPSDSSQEGWTPLLAAVQAASLERVRLLLSHGADVHATEDIGLNTALHLAVRHGSGEMVAALLKAGANARARSKIGWFPHDLVQYRRPDSQIVERLLRDALEESPITADTVQLVGQLTLGERLMPHVRFDGWDAVEDSGRVLIRSRMFIRSPKVDVSFNVYVRVGAEEFLVGSFCKRLGHGRYSDLECILAERPRSVTCILRPNPELAVECLDSGRIWGEEILFRNMRVRTAEND